MTNQETTNRTTRPKETSGVCPFGWKHIGDTTSIYARRLTTPTDPAVTEVGGGDDSRDVDMEQCSEPSDIDHEDSMEQRPDQSKHYSPSTHRTCSHSRLFHPNKRHPQEIEHSPPLLTIVVGTATQLAAGTSNPCPPHESQPSRVHIGPRCTGPPNRCKQDAASLGVDHHGGTRRFLYRRQFALAFSVVSCRPNTWQPRYQYNLE